MLRFGVLGPLIAADDRGPVDLKGPRHRAVLARLLVARGRVVPVPILIDALWGSAAPDGAIGALQTFVSALRRALEPDRPPRSPARVLVTSAPGYALRTPSETVDAWRFADAVAASRDAPADDVVKSLDEALGTWRGPAYGEFGEHPWARAEAARLDGLRLLALERRAEAMLALGRAAEVAPDLEAVVDAFPGREGAWRLYALALYRAGRQSDALGALRRARRGLAEGAGLDPGPELRALEAAILAQDPSLLPAPHTPPAPAAVTPAPAAVPPVVPGAGAESHATAPGAGPASVARAGVRGPDLVGRVDESSQLLAAAADVRARGALRLALVSGEAGAGKTTLATAVADRLADDGWLTAWGTNPDDPGLPAGWPWDQILTTLAEPLSPRPSAPSHPDGSPPTPVLTTPTASAPGGSDVPVFGGSVASVWGNSAVPGGSAASGTEGSGVPSGGNSVSGGDPAVARFRWQRAVGEYLASVARRAPLLLVVDDLHWAGAETLELLTALVTEPLPAPVLLVCTYRSTDLPPPLAGALGRVARAEPVRIYLGGLAATEIPALVRATTGSEVTADVAATIHRRTGGNPFFVRELARLVAADGDLADVPPGVRDVVRYRVAALPEPAQVVLRQAAVLGPDLDVDLQTALTGDHSVVLDVVDLATARGFLVARGPRRFAFAHALVRDALASEVSVARRASWHAAAADALERLRPDDVEALAHHYLSADDPATAGPATAHRAYRYARAAAERAEARWAPSEAARLWSAALTAFDRATSGPAREPGPARESGPAREFERAGVSDENLRTRLELLMGYVRALAVTGDLARARHSRAEAVALAEGLGDPLVTARVIGAFDLPAIWTDPDDPALARHIADVAGRTLTALPAGHPADRSRLLATIALELRSSGGTRAADAAREAEELARALDDPGVLAFALNARFMQSFGRAGLAPERARIGAELVALSERADLRTFEILGHLIQLQASAALADFTAADAHAETTDRLGDAYQSPLAGVFTAWYRAMRASIRGDSAGAEARWRAAGAHLAGTGMSGLDRGVLPFALFCQALRTGEDLGVFADADFGVFEPWARPHAVSGDDETAPGSPEARRIAAAIPESPRDLLFEVRTCLHALTAIAARDHELMERLYTALLPARDELAGAGSGLLTLDPVARYLSNLASALRRPDDAKTHHHEAIRVLARART